MPLEFEYNRSLSVIKGVGPKILSKLAICGLSTFRDALFHFPIRYEDKTKITPFVSGVQDEPVLVQGVIKNINFFKKNMWVEIEEDTIINQPLCSDTPQSQPLRLIFFNINAAHRNQFKNNRLVRCYGKIRLDSNKLCMQHPDITFLSHSAEPLMTTLLPIYATTEGLYQSHLRKIMAQVLAEFSAQWGNTQTAQALVCMHQPEANIESESILGRQHPLCQHLISEELSSHLLSLKKNQVAMPINQGVKLKFSQKVKDNIALFFERLPFQLTSSQKQVIQEILKDLESERVMMRLVQGDVGSGKTLIAAVSALSVLTQGKQVACLAPTEILASQLFQKFKAWFDAFGFECLFLSGSLSTKEKSTILNSLREKQSVMVIGTHALFQESVEFHQLGLIIIDEQHRFGVHQRLALLGKGPDGEQAHQLVMTATPIPRTLALTQYANLAVSCINELPANRQPIKTVMMSESRRLEVIQKMHNLCLLGQQIYWLCTAIDESESCQSAEESFHLLQTECPNFKIGLIHGRLSLQDKESIMNAFHAGEIHILVATTVIEVGVDVPNATLMVIENPERLGLAQLHQLRGRVGRGELQSFCILLYKQPLSDKAKARLMVLRDSQDGFLIAEKDLELRGAGDFLGSKQSGLANFKIADWVRDKDLILKMAGELPELNEEEQVILIERWIGEGENQAFCS